MKPRPRSDVDIESVEKKTMIFKKRESVIAKMLALSWVEKLCEARAITS
jgi:hypothetical protein